MILHDHSTDEVVLLQLHLGGDRNFQYLLADPDSGRAAVVDPGFGAKRLAGLADDRGLEIELILITHGHSDHVGGAAELAGLTGARVLAGDEGSVPGATGLQDDQIVPLGGVSIRALATPGHAPDHFCFLCGDFLLTGDLLFCGKIGGTGPYFPGSDPRAEYESLQRILCLPRRTRVLPGHDYYGGEGVMQHSAIGFEQDNNPFLLCPDFDAFCRLKEDWAAYKKEHGIR